MAESELESDTTRRADYYKKKIELITKDYENINTQKNQELQEIFDEIGLENDNLKKDLLLTREELEEEIEKNLNIKNTIFNFNHFSKEVNDDLDMNTEKKELKEEDYTSSIFIDYITAIKEEAIKKLSSLSLEHENNIKNIESMKNILENKIKNIYNVIQENNNINNYINDIIKDLNIYNTKFNSLLIENFSTKKLSIILKEKLGLSREEIFFLKERIIKEKKIILEKINELVADNKLNHMNMTYEILNEINNKRKNYFNEQFLIPINNIKMNFLEYKEKEKELKNKNEIMEKELDEIKSKWETINEEKNELINNASKYVINKENNKNNEIYLQSMINKLKKEKEILENENNSLIKNNSQLNEQVITINNKIKFEISQNKKSNESLLYQKDSLIKELNKKINNFIEINLRDKNTIENINNENESLNNKIKEYKINENNLKSELILLKKKLNESIHKITTMDQTNTTETVNNQKKLSNLQAEKKGTKEKIDSINNNNNQLNSLSPEQNIVNNNNNEIIKSIASEKIVDTGDNNINVGVIIRKIYLNHISNYIDNNDEIFMLQEINTKLTELENNITDSTDKNKFIKVKLVYNEDFEGLEQNKNSQLYENILIYLFNLESQYKIEINKLMSNNIDIPYQNNNKNKSVLQILDNLKSDLNEKCNNFERRIKNSINIDEVEQLILNVKNFYEKVIDNIIKNFYNSKKNLSGNILTIQMLLDKYDQIINNTMANLSNIEANIINKINEYKSQKGKIENAMNILLDNINNVS